MYESENEICKPFREFGFWSYSIHFQSDVRDLAEAVWTLTTVAWDRLPAGEAADDHD